MCRLIVARGSFSTAAVLDAAVAMASGDLADHETPTPCHPDGWGAIWRDSSSGGSQLRVHRDVRPIWRSAGASPLAGLRTDFLAIHARHATRPSTKGLEFTHPLERPGPGGPWYFMHNGYLPTVHRLLGRARSTFDSADYFDYIVPPGAASLYREETLERLRAIPSGGSSGNAVAVNPRRAFVIHWSAPDTPYPRYFGMRRLARPGLLAIASEACPSVGPPRHWEPLPAAQVLEIPLATAEREI